MIMTQGQKQGSRLHYWHVSLSQKNILDIFARGHMLISGVVAKCGWRRRNTLSQGCQTQLT